MIDFISKSYAFTALLMDGSQDELIGQSNNIENTNGMIKLK